jgi:hypothetical protein
LVFGFVVEKEGIVSNQWMFALVAKSVIFKKKGRAFRPIDVEVWNFSLLKHANGFPRV